MSKVPSPSDDQLPPGVPPGGPSPAGGRPAGDSTSPGESASSLPGAERVAAGPFDLPALESHLGHTFQDRDLLRTALRHKSFVNEKGAGLGHNERLEFLGDAVLQLAVTQLLMEAGTGFSEGELSLWRSQVVSEVSLSQLAAQIELGQFLVLGRGEEQSGGRSKPSLLADAYEAVIGAVYKDTGFDYALRLLRRLLGPVIERVVHSGAADYKSALQELLQRTEKTRPRYEVVDAFGPDHEKTFAVAVYCNNVKLGTATGRSKREAEHRCAALALERLQQGVAAAAITADTDYEAKGAGSSSAEPISDAVRSGAPR